MMRRGVGVVVAVACVQLAAADSKPARALDKPAMTATAGELLALAKAAPAGDAEVDILREDDDAGLDERGCATMRRRWVFVARAQQDLDDWRTIQAGWDPSYQDQPTIRARVIDPAGTVALLDPAAITEPVLPGAASSHWRSVQAVLPPLQIGSVVEQEIVTIDREPALTIGGLVTTRLGGGTPAASTVITLSAPAGRKAHQVARKLPASARTAHRIEHGREIWRTEIGAMPMAPMEVDPPRELTTTPYVGVATAASWAAVASAYRTTIDHRIAAGPFVLPAELPRTPSIETARAITAWLHHTLKPAAPDFDPDLALPEPPAETVRRGTGGNDDRAALLVSLLRQAGMTAELVLVAAGGRTPDPELPGLAAFGRTLVRVRIDSRELWIDPSEPLARPGELHARDRDRGALVIANDTRALTTTPGAVAADNVMREVRTFVAAELGPAQVTEVTRATGTFEIEQRRWDRSTPPAAMTKNATAYARAQYAGALVRRTATAPDDLTTPSAITIEVKDAHRMYTEREQTDVFLYPSATLDKLPWIVTHRAEAPRTADFAWPTPHVYEIENQIVVPAGYTLPAPAPDRTRAIGTASFTEHQEAAGQRFVVRFRFDSGKRRLTAAELGQLQDAVAGLEDEVVHLKIDLTSAALSYAGKPREAIAEAERLIALHPREAVHHDQLAQVLLRAGAGEAARREARKAVALAPADPDALTALGGVLSSDTLGRPYGFDWDRAGAIAALQQARKLAPKPVGAALLLSDVALHNAHGRAFEPGADLVLALDAARAVLAVEKTDPHALAVVKLLSWLGRYAEAATLAETVTSTARDPWLVVAAAALRGPAAAIQKAGSLRSGAERGKLIDEAAAVLMLLRLYEPARTMYAETGMLARFGAATAMMAHLEVQPDVPAVTKDPLVAARAVLLSCTDRERDAQVFWSTDIQQLYQRDCAGTTKPGTRDLMTTTLLADLIQSNLTMTVQGDAAAWRIEGAVAGQPFHMYLALDRGGAKLLGGPDLWPGVGIYLARLLERGRDDVARRLLDWFAQDADPKLASTAMFQQLWGAGLPTDRVQMQRATALLAGQSDGKRAIALLGTCTTTIASVERACHQVLLSAYISARRWADVEAEYARVVAADPTSARVFWRGRVDALTQLGRFDDADHALDDVLASDPANRAAKIARIGVALGRGEPDEALRRADAIASGATPGLTELNLAAWLRVTLDRDLDAGLELARRAVAQDATAFGVLNTLAVTEVEHGDLAAAMVDGWKAMTSYTHAAPHNGDWYLIGRLYEQLGLPSDAIAAYRRITVGEVPWGSPYELAATRLTALHASH